MRHAAVANDRQRVVSPARMRLGKSDHEHTGRHLRGERREFARARVDKRGAQHEILRGITAKREFGRHHERRARTEGFRRRVENATGIGGQVADRLIELGDRQRHATILAFARCHPWTLAAKA